MSGRGDNLGDVIRREIAAILAPLAEKTPREIALGVPARVTYYALTPACETSDVSLTSELPGTRNGLGELAVSEFATQYPLLPPKATPVGVSCDMNAVMHHEATFVPNGAQIRGVSFESMAKRDAVAIHIPRWKREAMEIPVEKPVTGARMIEPRRFRLQEKIKIAKREVAGIKVRQKEFPANTWGLPLTKNPIPPHRFSIRMKDLFRKTLARKVDTSPANIQIRLVFDRMNMSLFEDIEQDKQGRLMCYPKSRYIGKNWARYHTEAERPAMYLVFGTVINTGQSVNALVSGELAGDDGEPS